jgi:hypothetical protein
MDTVISLRDTIPTVLVVLALVFLKECIDQWESEGAHKGGRDTSRRCRLSFLCL